jgi:hypothetical protein
MRKITIFVEDFGHEEFIKTLLDRFSEDFEIPVEISSSSVRGGHGRALGELKQFLSEMTRGYQNIPDLIIVAIDSNCKGFHAFGKEIDSCVAEYRTILIKAIPDPHIERWLLLDSTAFKMVFGKGCMAPDLKCERDRYKQKLAQAIIATGIIPYLGGTEYTKDIVMAMDLEKMSRSGETLGIFLNDLSAKFNEWKKTE